MSFSVKAICAAAAMSAVLPAGMAHAAGAATPIKHLVVIFGENISFDHYFATYPTAANLVGDPASAPKFMAAPDTPVPNGLGTVNSNSELLVTNPNSAAPWRISPADAVTCDNDNGYADEQSAYDTGLVDKFPQKTSAQPPALNTVTHQPCDANLAMGYYDGNTVTALWNYAQHFAMSDNSFGTTFGPSTPGLLNLVAGTTFQGTITNGLSATGNIAGAVTTGAVIGDPDPAFDVCSNPKRTQISMSGQNIGDLLNAAGVTWGSFMGGFSNCANVSTGSTGLSTADYIPHHAFFQYWQSTANPNHVPRTSVAMIGHQGDAANHEYDLSDFWDALAAHNLPAVSFLKAKAIQDGHAGYSDPLDEQQFLVSTINRLEASPEWASTAVVISYDDSDGWYDHQMGPIVNQSDVADDQLLGAGDCGTPKPLPDGSIQNGRCGYGPRLPLLVISPYARFNYVDHQVTDQSSITRFIEDNWQLGRIGNGSTDTIAGTLDGLFNFSFAANPPLFLNPVTGKPLF